MALIGAIFLVGMGIGAATSGVEAGLNQKQIDCQATNIAEQMDEYTKSTNELLERLDTLDSAYVQSYDDSVAAIIHTTTAIKNLAETHNEEMYYMKFKLFVTGVIMFAFLLIKYLW